METRPLSRSTLLAMRADHLARERGATIFGILCEMRQKVSQKALAGETRYVHILNYIVGRSTLLDTSGKPIDITFDDIRESLMKDIHLLFPGSKVEYIERRPTDDIFTQAEARHRPHKPYSDGIHRAIVIDWD